MGYFQYNSLFISVKKAGYGCGIVSVLLKNIDNHQEGKNP